MPMVASWASRREAASGPAWQVLGGGLCAFYLSEGPEGRGLGFSLFGGVGGGVGEWGVTDMFVGGLHDNGGPRHFYERLGGVYIDTQPITFGSASLPEVSYGWR